MFSHQTLVEILLTQAGPIRHKLRLEESLVVKMFLWPTQEQLMIFCNGQSFGAEIWQVDLIT
jgi:hypothetical protein